MEKKKTFNPRLIVLLVIILLTAASRIPNAAQTVLWAHFTPIGAIALFGGTYFARWKAFLFPLLALFCSDIAISYFVFNGKYGLLYGEWYIVYGIFALIVLLGKLMIRRVTVRNVVLAAVSAAVLHWLVADFGIWLKGGKDLRTMLPLSRDFSGLMQSYVQGFPFMRVFLAGTLIYGAIMFGVYEWLKRKNPALQVSIANRE
jgi:hypothetical protein